MNIFEYDEELHKQTLLEEGYEDGFSDGFNDGLKDGAARTLIALICRKLKKGKTEERIADELEEDLETIHHICEVAKQFAPEYDVNAILERL